MAVRAFADALGLAMIRRCGWGVGDMNANQMHVPDADAHVQLVMHACEKRGCPCCVSTSTMPIAVQVTHTCCASRSSSTTCRA